jgi:putative ATP-grasp target RiPP
MHRVIAAVPRVIGLVLAGSFLSTGCADSGTTMIEVSDVPAALAVSVDPTTQGQIVVAGDQLVMEVGDSVTLTATATNALGVAVPTGGVTWSSSDDGVAQVGASGLVLAVGPGTADIIAESGGVAGGVRAVVNDTVPLFGGTP